jgi:hypothetical protein
LCSRVFVGFFWCWLKLAESELIAVLFIPPLIPVGSAGMDRNSSGMDWNPVESTGIDRNT